MKHQNSEFANWQEILQFREGFLKSLAIYPERAVNFSEHLDPRGIDAFEKGHSCLDINIEHIFDQEFGLTRNIFPLRVIEVKLAFHYFIKYFILVTPLERERTAK